MFYKQTIKKEKMANSSYKSVDGFISKNEQTLLYKLATTTKVGDIIVEIGSYHGKSTCALAQGKYKVYAIDPHSEAGNIEAFQSNIRQCGIQNKIIQIRKKSRDAVPDVPENIAVLFIDGAHDAYNTLIDFVEYESKIAPGGYILFHDAAASIMPWGRSSVVYDIVKRNVIDSPHWRNVKRIDSIIYAQKHKPTVWDFYISRGLLQCQLKILQIMTDFMSVGMESIPQHRQALRRIFRLNSKQ